MLLLLADFVSELSEVGDGRADFPHAGCSPDHAGHCGMHVTMSVTSLWHVDVTMPAPGGSYHYRHLSRGHPRERRCRALLIERNLMIKPDESAGPVDENRAFLNARSGQSECPLHVRYWGLKQTRHAQSEFFRL
jgi:hypothetical protein